jgi:hypothetical protein
MNGKKFVEIEGDLIKRKSIVEVTKIYTQSYSNGFFSSTKEVYFIVHYSHNRYSKISKSYKTIVDKYLSTVFIEQKRNDIIKLITEL